MNQLSRLISIILLSGLILSACAPAAQPAEQQPAPTEPPAAATEAAAAPPAADAGQPTAAAQEAAPSVQHTSIPGEPPTSGGEKWGDHSTISSTSPVRALVGDRFSEGKFERPYNANTMDIHFPQLDIDRAVVYPEDPTWVYAVITMVGRDAGDVFSGQYALELDLDRNGRGEILILVDRPSSAEWSTQGIWVYTDANADIGGVSPFDADSAGATSDGYENVLFDQGSGDDPDLAWVRLDPNNPTSFQIAYKQALLGEVTKYTAGVLAGTSLNPALFDYNDHFTHEQAGAANPDLPNFYPIKGLAEFDNTCRQAIGYDPTGLEPGLCPVQ
jgi:hypothetical protein